MAITFQVVYTNEAFELWYLLHFDYIDEELERKGKDKRGGYIKKLEDKKRLGHKYQKNSETIYEELLGRQSNAIRNANKLLEYHKSVDPNNSLDPAKNNPSTKVHLLVAELNKRLQKPKK